MEAQTVIQRPPGRSSVNPGLTEPKPATGGPLDCAVAESFASLEPVRDEWDRLAVQLGAPVYMSFDWARIWWQFYGWGRALRIFLFRDGPNLVAVVPIYLDDLGVGPLRLRVARLVGSNIPPKVFDPPIEPSKANEVWESLLRRLLTQEGCDVVNLGPLSERYAPAAALVSATTALSRSCHPPETAQEEVHTVYDLPPSFDDYINSLDPKERKTRRRKLRDLDELGSAVSRVVQMPEEVGGQFEEFVRDHTAQWQAENRSGHFYSWPDALDYNRELVRVHGRLGRVRFFRLECGDRCVASQYAFAFGRRLYAELPCRAFGPEWERLSLGGSSQIKLIEAAIEEGFTQVESGLGHYSYKILTGGRECAARTFRITNRSFLTSLRLPWYRLYSRVVRTVVLKIWYRRIMPKLPAGLRGGQPRFALRADL